MKLLLKLYQTIVGITVLLLCCLTLFTPAFCQSDLINFDLNDQSMAEVANLISKQLNYKILMDEELTKVTVSGKFYNVTLDDFFSRRIFRGTNIIVLYNDEKRMVKISSFGKKNRIIEYDQTSYSNSNAIIPETDPLDMEIQPGVKRRDAVFHESNTDPMDREIQPGIKRRDVVQVANNIDPLDMEIQPGVKRRDLVQEYTPVDSHEVEVQPGIMRQDVSFPALDIDPLDMEVQPGIKRRDTLGLTK